MRRQVWQNLAVGLFVAGVLAYGAYFIYKTSEESTILFNSFTIHTTMTNANGIKYYAPVRIHGIRVGKVETVKFSEDPGEDLVYVTMSIDADYKDLIAIGNPDDGAPAKDPNGIFAYLYISSEGLLGDNLLEIYAGKPDLAVAASKLAVWEEAARAIQEQWTEIGRDWDPVAAKPEIQPLNDRLLAELPNLGAGHVENGSFLRTKPGGAGLAGITESLDPTLLRVNKLLDAARTEPGLIHTLIYDPKGAELMDRLTKAVAEIQGLLSDIRTKPGGLHEVIYGSQLKAILNDLTGVSDKLKKAIGDVQGVTASVNQIIKGVKDKDLVSNLKGTLANVEEVTRKIKDGEGSLGMLVTDKSLYEDLQELLGGAKRSTVIKEAIRYVRSKNRKEQEQLNQMYPPPPATAPAAPGGTPKP